MTNSQVLNKAKRDTEIGTLKLKLRIARYVAKHGHDLTAVRAERRVSDHAEQLRLLGLTETEIEAVA